MRKDENVKRNSEEENEKGKMRDETCVNSFPENPIEIIKNPLAIECISFVL